MNLRNILLLTVLAVFMSGCVINPRPLPLRDNPYDDGYYDYRGTPSYEGYYYARIIFIRNVPYYVEDDRYIRPIPPRLYDHFRRYPYDSLGHPPMFSRDNEVRDGYRMSHIIYLDGVPYHVENDHSAQPLPEHLHQRFRYIPGNQGNAPASGNRPQPFGQHDNDRNIEPLVHRRDRERIEQPPLDREQREGGSGTAADAKSGTTPFFEQRRLPLRQDQPKAGESHAATPSVKERDLNANRPQTIDDSGKKKIDKKKSHLGKKEKKGDRPQADDDRKKPRNDNRRD